MGVPDLLQVLRARSSRASKVSGGICSWMAVRNAPQAAASWEILRAMPRSSGAPPDLRVRASACMPRGRRTSSSPGTLLQRSASARRVSSLAETPQEQLLGQVLGRQPVEQGSSATSSGSPASVPASLGMGSDMATPSTNMNVIWCLHARPILSRPPPVPADCGLGKGNLRTRWVAFSCVRISYRLHIWWARRQTKASGSWPIPPGNTPSW